MSYPHFFEWKKTWKKAKAKSQENGQKYRRLCFLYTCSLKMKKGERKISSHSI